jgi:hypothetical protein
MFIGHFAAKKFAPRTSMAALLTAPLFLDMLWPIFLPFGWEHARIDPGNTRFTPLDLYNFPWSHSLLMSIVWATAFALIYYQLTRYKPGTIASMSEIAWTGLIASPILILWAWWFDHHRVPCRRPITEP